jgi:DDE superfamily endonuclease
MGTLTGDYLWHMEDIRYQYALPYDPLRPLICFDERPCQLLGDVLVPLPMKPGRPLRSDYEYERHGTCCVLLAFDPHRGFRYLEVRPRRTALDSAQFMHTLVQRYYPTAACIRLVQDNLNTHTPGSFYQALPPEQAFDFAQKFALHYTPKKGSWLNMAEIELAALSKQCLDRRIADQETLTKEAHMWQHRRNRARTTVQWRFTQVEARRKLQGKYPALTN